MSYYQYMQSVYRSYLPQLNRSLRSSSVERLEGVRNQIRSTSVEATSRNMRSSSVDRSNFYTSQLADTSRYMRSASVGPCENLYTFSSAMPFALEADKATERVMARRAASVEPVILPRKSFSYADHYASNCQPGAGYSAFDYKVIDYGSRLDREETTRSYINQRKAQLATEPVARYEPNTYRSRYDYYGAMKHEKDFMYDRSSVERDFHCYRKSKQTLEARNQRAKSPLATRELDRYYGTEKRSSFSGDVSSGGSRDFRFYNYRAVPYFGGSDNYALSKRRLPKK